MKIVLELALIAEAKRGIDYYIDNVVDALARVDKNNEYTLFSYFWRRHAEKAARLPAPAGFTTRYVRFPETLVRALDHRRGIPITQSLLLGGLKPDIYHVLAGGCLPHLTGPKTVVTFFDLSDEQWPKDGSRPDPGKKIASPYTYDLAKRADRIVATGEFTKSELGRYYGVPGEKISVISTGVDLRRFKPFSETSVAKRYGLPENYLLIVGPYVPLMRNNADFVLRAFAKIKDGAGKGCSLVMTGHRGEPLEKLLSLSRALGIADRIVLPGYVSVDDLAAVYSRATAVVHPTSVEGFGYGLEVLACGTPFVTSNRPGVLEAVGDAALTVPPQDEGTLKDALERILTDESLRTSLRGKGLARAARFSYDEIARKLVALYGTLAS